MRKEKTEPVNLKKSTRVSKVARKLLKIRDETKTVASPRKSNPKIRSPHSKKSVKKSQRYTEKYKDNANLHSFPLDYSYDMSSRHGSISKLSLFAPQTRESASLNRVSDF
jgi:competence CoiA-like predicted nuclease